LNSFIIYNKQMSELESLTLEYQQLKEEEQQIEQELEELNAHYPKSSLRFVLGRESMSRQSEIINRQAMYQEQLIERYYQVLDRQINISMQVARLRMRQHSEQNQSSSCSIQ